MSGPFQITLSVLTAHHANEGCKCKACYGLAEYMLALTGRDHGLPRTEPPPEAQSVPLRPVEEFCDGTLICECKRCESERAQRVDQPPKTPRQPWELAA